MTLIGLTGGMPGDFVALEIGATARTAVVRSADPDLVDDGPIENIFTIERASGGLSFEAGAWTWVGNDVPRYDEDGRLLSEPQRTNLWLYASDMTSGTGQWQQFNVSVPAVDQVRETTATGAHRIRQRQAIANGTYTWTFDLDGVGRSEFYLVLETSGNFSNRLEAIIDLDAATVTSVTNFGTYSGGAVAIADEDADGYRKVTVSFSTGTKGGDGTVWAAVYPRVGGSASYTGEVAKGFNMRRTQVEAGAFATSHIPTVASTVTRAADSITKPTAEFDWNSGSGTLTIDGSPVTPVITGSDLDVSATLSAAGAQSFDTLQWVTAP